MIWIR